MSRKLPTVRYKRLSDGVVSGYYKCPSTYSKLARNCINKKQLDEARKLAGLTWLVSWGDFTKTQVLNDE